MCLLLLGQHCFQTLSALFQKLNGKGETTVLACIDNSQCSVILILPLGKKKKTLKGAMESQDPLHFFDTYFFVFKTHQMMWANAGHFLLWTARETVDILEVSRKGFLKNEWTWCEPENTVSGMSCCQLLPLLPSSLSYGSSVSWIVSGTKTKSSPWSSWHSSWGTDYPE